MAVAVENTLVERLITAVVHAEHDGHDRGFVGENIMLEPLSDGAAAAAGDPIAAPAGVGEGDLGGGESGDDKSLRKRGVETLVGDAIAVKNDTVAVFKIKIAGRAGSLGKNCEDKCTG